MDTKSQDRRRRLVYSICVIGYKVLLLLLKSGNEEFKFNLNLNSYAAARPDSLLVSGVGVQQRNVTRVVTCYSSSNGMFMYKIIHYPLFGHINYMSHVVVSPLCLG